MQSKNRKVKRIIAGMQSPTTNSSKTAKGRQVIQLGVTKTSVSYLTATGLRLEKLGEVKAVLDKHRKNRITFTYPKVRREKVIYHKD